MWFRSIRLRLAVTAGLIAVIATTSCATRTHITCDGRADHLPSTEGTDPHFVYPSRKPSIVEDQVTNKSSRYEIRRLSFPSIGGNGQTDNLVTVDYHRSRLPGAHPVVIVLPIWGRHVYPSNAITRTFRKRSNGAFHILNVMGESFLIDWPQLGVVTDEDEFMELWAEGAQNEINTLIDTRRLIDWAERQPEIDTDHIGLVGFSHGAMLRTDHRHPGAEDHGDGVGHGRGRTRRGSSPSAGALEPRVSRSGPRRRSVGAEPRWKNASNPSTAPWIRLGIPTASTRHRSSSSKPARTSAYPRAAATISGRPWVGPSATIINANHRHAFYTMTPLNLNWMRKRIWEFLESAAA